MSLELSLVLALVEFLYSKPHSLPATLPPVFYPPAPADRNGASTFRPSNATSTYANEGGPETNRIPISEHNSGSQDELFDVLSDYDDSTSDLTSESATRKTRPDVTDARGVTTAPHIQDEDDDDESTYSSYLDQTNSSPPPMFAPKPTPPHLHLEKVDLQLQQESVPRGPDSQSPQSSLNKPLPKSPSATSPFATFFGWGNSPAATEFSSVPTPLTPGRKGDINDTLKEGANVSPSSALKYCESYLSTPPPSSHSLVHVEEMEEELKAISTELASSIRREIDLEDLVDRLQDQVNTAQIPSKRTSDYFSDSGYSSAKLSEADQARDEIDKIQRRSEQEKASLRLELTNKLQDERSKRKALDLQIKGLAERASQIDLAQINNVDANERVQELENTCEDLRRRLSEERSSTNNFEDLLSALKDQLQSACNERDNLRDEVVPQLRARVEGLEAEASEYANLTYESSKMQQELQNLKQENINLRRGSVISQMEQPTRGSRAFSGGLSRSNSVAAGSQMRSQRPPMGLSRSNSVKAGQAEPREVLAERLKDVEAQRDALHGALKNLLERQEFQSREYEKRIRLLETERDRLLTGSHKKGGFEREIMNLRTEINVLRRRAEDALEQKWQVEKGLSGLKMDLDRAEGEIASLRELLNEKDILIPETLARSSGSSDGFGETVTSQSLSEAYTKLQSAYADSLERVKKLEANVMSDENMQAAIQRLEKSLSVAVTERDAIQGRYDQAYESEVKSVEAESALAEDLCESARQIEVLASQVQQQLSANAELRQRLANAVVRGDADRQANNDRITMLMERLGDLEDQLVNAQTTSEDRVNRHEDEVSKLRDAHNGHLRRMDGSPSLGGLRSPTIRSARKTSFLSPSAGSSLFPSMLSPKSFEDEAEMKGLRSKVAELERALADAEQEMQEVVARMSTAQVEVMNLQEERDAAVRETRRLQKLLEREEMKTFEERFKSLRGNVAM